MASIRSSLPLPRRAALPRLAVRSGTLALAALVGALGASALAQDAPLRADPREPSRWKKDEVVHASVVETTDTKIAIPGAARQVPPGLEGGTKIEVKFTRRCVEAGEDGALVRSLVRIDAWSALLGGHEDRCIDGAIVETGPDGFVLVSSPGNPSRLARGWLANRFGKNGRGFAGGLAETGATGPVGAGDSWEAEPTAIAGGLTSGGMPVPVPSRKWKFTVAEAVPTPSGTSLKIAFDERFDVDGETQREGVKFRVAKGSFVRTRGSVAGTPGLWHRTGRMEVVSEQEVATAANGMEMKVACTATERETWDAGGTPPALPPELPAAGAVAARRIGGDERWEPGTTTLEKGRVRTTTLTTPIGTDGKTGAAIETGRTFAWGAEIHCAEAFDDGQPRTLLVSFTDWKATEEDVTDECLTGTVVRVARGGWRFVDGGGDATDDAKEWLQARFGDGPRRDDAMRAAATPAMLVAPGTSWALDPMDAAASLAPRFGFPIDPFSVRGNGTLKVLGGDGADAESALEYDVEGIVSCAPGCGGAGAGVLKGDLRVHGTASGPASRWTRLGSFRDRTELTSNAPGLMAGEELRRVAIVEERDVVRAPMPPEAEKARALTLSAMKKLEAKDTDGALADVERAIAADSGFARGWAARARVRLAKKDSPGAIDDATKALALDPRSVDALTVRSTARKNAGDIDGEIADLTKWTEVSPRNARAWYFRGRARAAKGDQDGALADFTEAVALNDKYSDAFTARAGLRFERDEFDLAIDDYTTVVELRPNDANAWCNRANARSANKLYDEAIEDAGIAIGLDEKNARAYFVRAIALGGKNDVEGQLADCAKALQLDERYTAVLRYRASVREDLHAWKDAVDDWSRALEQDPKSMDARLGCARTMSLAGNAQAALSHCMQAIESDPTRTAVWLTRGDVRQRAFDDEGAVVDWKRAAELDPKDSRALFQLARIRFRPGRPAAPVVEALRAALALGKRQDYGHLWLWLARTQAGEEAAATKELKEYVATRKAAEDDDEDAWYAQLSGFLTGTVSEESLLATAEASSEGPAKAEHLCEAAYYAGVVRALRGDTAKALVLLDRCLATDVRSFTEFTDALGWRAALALGAVTEAAAAGARKLAAVDPNGPAAKAGLRDGDVVVSADGAALSAAGVLQRLLVGAAPGTVVRLDVIRFDAPGVLDHSILRLDVILGAWPAR